MATAAPASRHTQAAARSSRPPRVLRTPDRGQATTWSPRASSGRPQRHRAGARGSGSRKRRRNKTRKSAESRASSDATGRTVSNLAAKGPDCEPRSASSAGPTARRCSAAARSSRALRRGAARPANAPGACSAALRKPRPPSRRTSCATRATAGGDGDDPSASNNALRAESTRASCASANSRVSQGASVCNANWVRGATVYRSRSHET